MNVLAACACYIFSQSFGSRSESRLPSSSSSAPYEYGQQNYQSSLPQSSYEPPRTTGYNPLPLRQQPYEHSSRPTYEAPVPTYDPPRPGYDPSKLGIRTPLIGQSSRPAAYNQVTPPAPHPQVNALSCYCWCWQCGQHEISCIERQIMDSY